MKRLEYRFRVGDKSWTVDFAALDVDTWIDLEKATGLKRRRLAAEFYEMSALGAKAAVYLCRRLDGERVAYADVTFRLDEFAFEEIAVDVGEPAAGNGQAPDPTEPAPSRMKTGSPTS